MRRGEVYDARLELSKSRFLRLRGNLSDTAIAQLNRALLIALDLPGQFDEEGSS